MCHTRFEYEGRQDVEEFLDAKILDICDLPEKQDIFARVSWTVELLNAVGGEDILVPDKTDNRNFASRFSLRSLEVIAVGIARNYDSISSLDDPHSFVKNRISDFWKDDGAVESLSGQGQRGTTRWGKTIPFGTDWFAA